MLELDTSNIQLGKWDRKFGIKLPTLITKELAYETGVQIGDGWLSTYVAKNPIRQAFQIGYCGNLKNELPYYENLLKPLIAILYGKNVTVRKKKIDNTCIIQFQSKSIFDFKTKVLGLSISPKNNISIPNVIFENKELAIECLRGIFDTDFSLVFLRKYKNVKYYPKIRGCSKSKILVKQLEIIFRKYLKLKPVIQLDEKRFDKRSNKFNYISVIEINGRKKVNKFMKFVGTSNRYINERYKIWKILDYYDDALIAQSVRARAW